jgi:tRNA-5-methyluridine54 2-sulfurtransferase
VRCIKCQDKAVTEIRRHNAAFCREHFLEYFDNQVVRNIRRHSMCDEGNQILVAVSGGKDSLALWDLLIRLGYRTTGLHVQLGIDGYSSKGHAASRQFAEKHDVQLITVDLARDYGMTVPELSRTLRRAPCSACGLSRRYVFNREALEGGFDIVATGHNLDDEAATLLGNVLHWQIGYLGHQSPILESTHPRLVRRIKPLYTLTEKETATYCLLKGIAYHAEECPNSAGARSLLYKDVLNRVEKESPGAKQSFVRGFLERARPTFDNESVELMECIVCGQPTTAQTCSFCRMWDRARNLRKAKRLREAER